jgi:1-acyl-sn-glycerol-3-phosphate acyltransferase
VRFFFYMCLLRTCGLAARALLKFRATGMEHLPRSGGFIISPNHQAFIDPLFVAAVLPFHAMRRMFSVGAAEHFAGPFTSWFAQMANIVPVDPDANLVTAMQAGATGLRLNKVLVLFPEGERSIDGELKKFKKGAAILSGQLDAPIVPVALDGLYDLWPRGRPLNWRGALTFRAAPVTIRFGPPLHVKRGEYAEGTAMLRQAVERMLVEIRQGQRAEGKGQR